MWEEAGLTHAVSLNHLLDCLSLFNVILATNAQLYWFVFGTQAVEGL